MKTRFWLVLTVVATFTLAVSRAQEQRETRNDQGNSAKKDDRNDPVTLLKVEDQLTKGDPVDPVLRKGFHKVYPFKMEADSYYQIDLVSKDFDAYLRLEDAKGKDLAQDDDSGGDLNARIVYKAANADSYRIIVTTYEAGATGKFTLNVKPSNKTLAERVAAEVKASQLNAAAFQHYQRGELDKAAQLCRTALALRKELFSKDQYPQGHPDVADSLNNLGYVLQEQGEYAGADMYYRQALAMYQMLYPRSRYSEGHPAVAATLNNLGDSLRAQSEYAKAELYHRQALEMRQQIYSKVRYPQGHPNLAQSLGNLGGLLMEQGEYTKAEPYYRQALEMRQQVYPKARYPKGHSELANSLNGLASLFLAQGEYTKAEAYHRRALEMCELLYPKASFPHGHRYLAICLNNLGGSLHNLREYAKAEPYYRRALEMYQQLYQKAGYPQGHELLATSLANLGGLLHDQGEYAKAESYSRQALEMRQVLFPKTRYPLGHPDLANSLSNLGFLLQAQGEYAKAEEYDRSAAAMRQQLLFRYAELASEAEALSYFAAIGKGVNLYLSDLCRRPHKASDYELLWNSQSLLTRVVERRHHDILAVKQVGAKKVGLELTQVRQRLARLLLTSQVNDADTHRQEVEKLTSKKEKLEKDLARVLQLEPPTLSPEDLTPAKLQKALPTQAVFLDIRRHIDVEQDPKVPGRKGHKLTPRYVAFVVSSSRIDRVELGEAAPIDKTWAAWRDAIVNNGHGERETASRFSDVVWAPLAMQMSSDTKTIYLAPDGLLTQVPWHALPGRKPGSVLLEEFTIATVPHGPYLLRRLTAPPGTSERGGILVIGDVDYEEPPIKIAALAEGQRGPLVGKVFWPALPGTKKELKQVAEMAASVKIKATSRSAVGASTDQVLTDLGEVRYAHLATHGFFADPKFRSVMQVDPKLFDSLDEKSKAVGARSPLVLSGLVFAGANRQSEKAAPDRGILTAEAIVGQRLEGMDLAVLSACETGLGEVGGGEGVYGLARAFHVAGCKNVIASLWKVDDEPTAALMGLFYRNLWVKKAPPLEALRQAQLHLYRHPEQIPELAKMRGSDFAESDLPKATLPTQTGRTARTSQWAAFVLSGTGR